MKRQTTRIGRVLVLWGLMFLVTLFLVARPTDFTWPFWIYGLIWDVSTSVLHYGFRRFFEEEIEVRR
jgi:hypothetical protein